MTFKDLHLVPQILQALEQKGYNNPTKIQEQSIPIILKNKDLLGCAQTGTGKTAAFAIPIIQQLYLNHKSKKQNYIKALIVTPTRELAIQIDDNFKAYAKHTNLRNTVIFGGVKQQKQVRRLQAGIDILTATPGRLLDLINQGYISLDRIEHFVLDEADRMLDMGFIHDIKKIIKLLPRERQSLFFSATMSSDIVSLSRKILGDPERVTIQPKQTTAEKVSQSVIYVPKKMKGDLLSDILSSKQPESTLVFSRTKYGANKIVKVLNKKGFTAEAIHGNKSQAARQKALANFKSGDTKVLVATDIAARGIDINELELVINYDLPNIPETYVHRIGRTGRADASGHAMSFCDNEERAFLKDIQKLIKQSIPEEEGYSDYKPDPSQHQDDSTKPNGNQSNGRHNGQGKKNKKKRWYPRSGKKSGNSSKGSNR